MNILILHSSSGLYGSSRILITVSKEFKKNGHGVLVILSEDGPLVEELHTAGIGTRIVRLGIIRRKYFSLAGIFNRFFILIKCFFTLSNIVKKQEIDLIYSNTTAVLIGSVVAKLKSVRHIWHVHETILKPVFICKLIGWLMRNCTEKIVVVSNGVLNHWLNFVHDRDKFILIYNGIDIEPFANKHSELRRELKIGEEPLLIGVIGMIHYIKGHEYFLRMGGEIQEHFPGTHFLIVGDAFPGYEGLIGDLENIAREEKINDHVHYLGFRKDIVNIINALDVLILPSVLPDSFPTVILEAMAAEKPVVATTQGGALEMVDTGVTGILIPINNPKNAILLMQPLLSDKQLRTKMGKEGNKHLRNNFSLEAFQKKIIDVIQ